MSKEMTAESEKFFNRRTVYPEYGEEQLPSMHVADAKHYGDLRAKEAVREFAEELMNGLKLLSVMGSVEPFVKHLAKQKGVEI